MEQTDYLKNLVSTLLKYRRDRFLCDVIIIAAESREVYAHSIVLASASNKLRAAFDQQKASKRHVYFRLNLPNCDVTTVEAVLQFVYTGSLPALGALVPEHITAVLTAGQKLGLDVSKLALILSAFVSLCDPNTLEFPPFVLTDDDLLLEIIEKDGHPSRAPAIEIIKLTSREQHVTSLKGGERVHDHSYTDHGRQSAESYGADFLASCTSSVPLGADTAVDHVNEVKPDDVEEGTKEDENGQEEEEEEDDEKEEHKIDLVGTEFQQPCAEYLYREAMLVNHDDMQHLSSLFKLKVEQDVVRSDDVTELGGFEESVMEEGQTVVGAAVMQLVGGGGAGDNEGVDYLTTEAADSLIGAIVNRVPCLSSASIASHAVRRRGRPLGSFSRTAALVGSLAARERVILICDHCGKSFQRAKEYAEHRRTHTGEKPYSCDLCGKSFSRRRTMTEHRRIHTGDRPHQCELCDKGFSTSGELVKHRRFHTGERPYQCDVCGKTFSRCGENADHKRMHAGELTCAICGKEFTRLHNMKEHMDSAHSGEKRFRCSICGKCFAYSSGLRYHRRLHRDDRPFACQLCGKGFARGGELARHERSAHKSRVVEIEVYG